MPQVRVGTSGYSYNHWKEIFYPAGTPQSRWLEFFAQEFHTVEINNSFYRLPERGTFENWRSRTPPGFVFSVKASRYITHVKRLKDRESLERFLHHARGLGEKLGPILFQLPPNMKADAGRLDEFLSWREKADTWAIEFRSDSWFSDEIYSLLQQHDTALCVQDMTPGCPAIATASIAYVRLHGTHVHDGNYDRTTLRRWADTLAGWLDGGKDVYAYFNNDVHGYAVFNARTLASLLKKRVPAALTV